MSVLTSLFDVLRGWPREGAIDESFTINQTTPGTDDSLPIGTVVYVTTTGTAALATTPNRSTTNAVATWVVVAGNDDFSSQFVHKVVCLRSNAMLKLDPANFAAASYTIGQKLTFSSGVFQGATTNNQIIAEVVQNNIATDGTLVIMYTGGDTASF